MSEQDAGNHQATIVEQFSRQAIPFAKVPGHLDAIGLLLEISAVSRDDLVLDVACGPGLVACEFARTARQVTGIDITPAMIKWKSNWRASWQRHSPSPEARSGFGR